MPIKSLFERLRCHRCGEQLLVWLDGENPESLGTLAEAEAGGWTLARREPMRTWLCPEHRGDMHEVALEQGADWFRSWKVAVSLHARLEALLQWATDRHHHAFSHDEIVAEVERLVRAEQARSTE